MVDALLGGIAFFVLLALFVGMLWMVWDTVRNFFDIAKMFGTRERDKSAARQAVIRMAEREDDRAREQDPTGAANKSAPRD